jgi:hypothetical protein
VYKIAEEHIRAGLSPFARFILGLFAALAGVVMIVVAPPTEKAILFYAFGGFCLLIAVACVTRGRLRQLLGSIIGCGLFGLSAFILYTELRAGPLISGHRGEPSVVGAVAFFLAFGVPGISYAIHARFGIPNRETTSGP